MKEFNMKLLVATNNAHKIHEYEEMFSPFGIEVTSPKALSIEVDPEENGTTFEANSLIKAKALQEFSKLPIIADDSGLCVEALDGFPGIHTARFAKENGGNPIANLKLIEMLKPYENKNAQFVCVITLLNVEKEPVQFKGVCKGHILPAPEGEGGFGYDPIFYSEEAKCCFGTAPEEVKNSFSHRSKALGQLIAFLKEKKLIN